MNVIFNRFSAQYAKQIKLALIKELNIKQAVSVDALSGQIQSSDDMPPNCNYTQYDLWDIQNAVYKNVDWNSITPVDEKIVEQLYRTESDVIRLYEKEQTIYNPFNTDTPIDELKPILDLMPQRYMQGILIGMPHDDRKRNYYLHVRFWNHILETKKINLLIFSASPHFIYEYIIYRLAELKGIPVIWSYHTGIIGSSGIYEGITDYGSSIPKVFNELKQKIQNPDNIKFEKQEFQDEWDRLNTNYKKQTNPIGGDIVLWDDLVTKTHKRFSKEIALNDKGKRKKKFSGVEKIKARLKQVTDIDYWHFRLKFKSIDHYTSKLQQYYETLCEEADYTKNYIYFPLHMQPEDSNAPRAGMYAHQEMMIDMLSYYIPKDWFIYIKEHPAQQYKHRSPLFYQYLKNNPKVKIIKKKQSSFELINFCKAVATINGTAGWEGLFKGKPCIMFGYFFYRHAPGVYHVRNNDECKRAIHTIVNNDTTFDILDLKYFLKAVELDTFRGGMLAENIAYWDYDDDQITEIMVPKFIEKINDLKTRKKL